MSWSVYDRTGYTVGQLRYWEEAGGVSYMECQACWEEFPEDELMYCEITGKEYCDACFEEKCHENDFE